MRILTFQEILNLTKLVDLEIERGYPNHIPLRELQDMGISHELLRNLVKDLLAELMIQSCENKDLLTEAKEAVTA